MAYFYSNYAYIGCPHGCNAKMQALTYNEEGQPTDCDWSQLQGVYNNHNSTCSVETPYIDDANSYYGDSEVCYTEPCSY